MRSRYDDVNNITSPFPFASFLQLYSHFSSNMPLHRRPQSECTSAGRVTARLLLSFLALSTPIAASSRQQEPDPILPPQLSQPDAPHPSGKEHAFVGLDGSLYRCVLTLTIRHYAMFSSTETSTAPPYIGGTTLYRTNRRYG